MRKTALTLWLCIVLIGLVACSPPATPTPASDQALAATVDAAVQATSQAQQNASATIDAAVKATSAAAQPATATAAPQATLQPAATAAPTPIPVEQYATMSEEELAALIDQTVAEAVAATSTASSSTTTATSDDAVTQAEVDSLTAAVNTATASIEAATAAIDAYYDLYGELATETLATLEAIEQELNTMNDSLDAIAESLNAINATLEQGLTLAQDTIDQLETAAQEAKTNLEDVQTQAQNWLKSVQAELERRTQAALNVQPDNVATDRRGALQNTSKYVDSVRAALGDNKLSPDELSTIARDGANASASLKAAGGPELKGLSDSINSLTTQLARGQMPQAKVSFDNFQRSMPSLPSAP